MQAIARVNRVFRDKPGGLVVDYLGLADELRQALALYTDAGGTGRAAIDQADAIALMREKYEVCLGLFHGFDWSHWTEGTAGQKLSLLPPAQEHILAQEDGKSRFTRAVTELSQAFALAVPADAAIEIRDDVGWLVEIHGMQARSVEAGKPHIANDHDFEWVGGIAKPIRKLFATRFVADKHSCLVIDELGKTNPILHHTASAAIRNLVSVLQIASR
nr:type I restriction enzyme endonuclease domain-containing protein [Devosia psychrophila]